MNWQVSQPALKTFVRRILDLIGADVRFFNPEGLPIKDDVSEGHEKVALTSAF